MRIVITIGVVCIYYLTSSVFAQYNSTKLDTLNNTVDNSNYEQQMLSINISTTDIYENIHLIISKMNTLTMEQKYLESFNLGFSTLKKMNSESRILPINLLRQMGMISLYGSFDLTSFISYLESYAYQKNRDVIVEFLTKFLNIFNTRSRFHISKILRFLPYASLYAQLISDETYQETDLRLHPIMNLDYFTEYISAWFSSINKTGNDSSLSKFSHYYEQDNLQAAEKIIPIYGNKYDKIVLSILIGNKYYKKNNLKEAERILITYNSPQEVFFMLRILAKNYFRDKKYNDCERVCLYIQNRLSYNLGFYLLISQSKIHSYKYALENFNKYKSYYAKNTSFTNQFWEYIADFYNGELNAIQVKEKLASVTDNKSKYQDYCMSNYLIGMKYLFDGNRHTAANYFSEAVSTDRKNLIEYQLALHELNKSIDLNLIVSDDKKTLAVANFDAYGFSLTEAKLVSNKLSSLLTTQDIFIILEREKMYEILKEQGFQLTGCISSECVVEAGQLLGVQLMLAGSLGRFGNLNIIDLRIIDVETSAIIKSISHEFEGRKELLFTYGLNQAVSILFE